MLAEILFATLALLAGVAGGRWLFGPKDDDADPAWKEEREATSRAAERVMLAIGQVHDVANRVAHDVGSHSSEVGRISAELESLKNSDADSFAAPAVSIIAEVLSANEKLQGQLAAAEEKLKAQAQEIANQQTAARTDSLTGLPNRRAFDQEIIRRFTDWQTRKVPFSLMVIDVDEFKSFNDTHGHLAGDEVLRQIGKKLREFTRNKDVACRYGGEEFVVIMPSSELKAAASAALRARKMIETMSIAWQGKRFHVTVSFGLAQIAANDEAAGLLRRADDALYAAKKAGRNCGYLHDGSRCFPVTEGGEPASRASKPEPTTPQVQLLPSLPDRDELDEELQRRVADSQQYGLPLSLISLQVLDYEQIRAELGQQPADLLLDAVATILHETIRGMDLLARDGSARLAVVLPGSTAAEATQVSKRIRTIAAGRKVQLGVKTVSISLAMGLSSYRSGDGVNALRLRAETGLAQQQEHVPATAGHSESTG